MRYVKQIGIILGITLAGEILNHVVPACAGRCVRPVHHAGSPDVRNCREAESVEGTGNFLMDTMTMMFIPATVGIVECIGEVKAVLVPFLITVIGISTLGLMAVTGCMAQWVMGRKHSGRSSDMRKAYG